MTVEIKTYHHASPSDPYSDKYTVAATFDMNDQALQMRCYGYELLNLIAEKIAEKFVNENYAELVSKLDQQAIANLAVADSGKKIAEEIRTRPVVLPSPGARINNNKYSIF
jgi:hypothetical protein